MTLQGDYKLHTRIVGQLYAISDMIYIKNDTNIMNIKNIEEILYTMMFDLYDI